MKRTTLILIFAFTAILFSGCSDDPVPGPQGPAGQDGLDGLDTEVYYSEWFAPSEWLGVSGDWYFTASAPDLTENIVEGGVILAYAWLADDLYEGMAVRPLPAYAVGANWSFLIPDYGSIEFTCDMLDLPSASGNQFRFVAIPGNIPSLKSASNNGRSVEELKKMSYQEVCKMFNIPER